MSADIVDRLRALTRDRLKGRLSVEAYRQLRAELLDGLVAPSATPILDNTLPREPTRLEATTQPRAAKPSSVANAPKPVNRAARYGPWRLAALVALGLLLTAAIVWVIEHHRSTAVAPRTAAPARNAQDIAGGRTDPLRPLLQPLLEDPHWSEARLVAVNEALLQAGPARIAAERQYAWFDAVVDAVRSRLSQQQALASAPLTPATSPLAALASTLGIRVSPNVQSSARKARAQAR